MSASHLLVKECCAETHNGNPGCVCEIKGKEVKITGIYSRNFKSDETIYTIQGSTKLVQMIELQEKK